MFCQKMIETTDNTLHYLIMGGIQVHTLLDREMIRFLKCTLSMLCECSEILKQLLKVLQASHKICIC